MSETLNLNLKDLARDLFTMICEPTWEECYSSEDLGVLTSFDFCVDECTENEKLCLCPDHDYITEDRWLWDNGWYGNEFDMNKCEEELKSLKKESVSIDFHIYETSLNPEGENLEIYVAINKNPEKPEYEKRVTYINTYSELIDFCYDLMRKKDDMKNFHAISGNRATEQLRKLKNCLKEISDFDYV